MARKEIDLSAAHEHIPDDDESRSQARDERNLIDQVLRANGWRIYSRPKSADALWWKDGVVAAQDDILGWINDQIHTA